MEAVDLFRVIDTDEPRARCEAYLSHFLDAQVKLVHATPLAKSTRDAPWRLDVSVNGAARSYVLRLDRAQDEHEYAVMRAMAGLPVPVPCVYGWDPEGRWLGASCFFCDYLEGESLLEPTLAREEWAERLFLDTVCALQAVRLSQLVPVARRLAVGQAVVDILEAANGFFQTHPNRLADAVYQELEATLPELPALRFSNGDLWLDNFIVRDQQLVGVIDFENAGFSDPIFEFLLPFFVAPELRGRGIEERYCRRMGYDPELLFWYRGLEYFDAWHWVAKTGKPFADYTVEKLKAALRHWLDQV